jgi:uncharacterized protein
MSMHEAEGQPPADVWRHPSAQLRKLRHTEAALVGAIAIIVSLLIGFLAGTMVVTGPLAIAFLVLAILADFFMQRRVRTWGYVERENHLLVQHGLLVSRLSVVPYGRMQFIDVSAGPAERLFKIATVRLHTAAAASDARIPGIDPSEAQRLRDQLASLGETQAAGL